MVNGISLNSFCQTNPTKNSIVIHKYDSVFEKKPNLDTLIDGIIKPFGYVNDYDNLFSAEEKYRLMNLVRTATYIEHFAEEKIISNKIVNSSNIDDINFKVEDRDGQFEKRQKLAPKQKDFPKICHNKK